MQLDLNDLIQTEHRAVGELLDVLGTDRDDRFQLAHRLIDELATHLAAVTQILLPAVRDVVPGGAELANRGQEQARDLRESLTALEGSHPGDEAFESALSTLNRDVRRHAAVEENDLVPALRTVIGEDKMRELGEVYDQLRQNMPSGLQAMPGTDRNPRFST